MSKYHYTVWTHISIEYEKEFKADDLFEKFPLKERKAAFLFYKEVVERFDSLLNSKTHQEKMKQQKIDALSITTTLSLWKEDAVPVSEEYNFPIKCSDKNVNCKQGLILDSIIDFCN
jgi:hypothetical protein